MLKYTINHLQQENGPGKKWWLCQKNLVMNLQNLHKMTLTLMMKLLQYSLLWKKQKDIPKTSPKANKSAKMSLAKKAEQNQELYHNFMTKNVPKILNQLGIDLSSESDD